MLLHVPRGVKGTPDDVIASVGARVLEYKKNLFLKYGLLTADDAMFATMKILQSRPDIARSVARTLPRRSTCSATAWPCTTS